MGGARRHSGCNIYGQKVFQDVKRALVVATEDFTAEFMNATSEWIIWAATHLICQGQLGLGSIGSKTK